MTYTMVTKQKTQMEKTIMTNKNTEIQEKDVDKDKGLLYNLYVVILNSLFK
jgi:hypothetical protein